jgi:peptidylprolyl isomerase
MPPAGRFVALRRPIARSATLLRSMGRQATKIIIALAAGVALAACGSKAPGVELAPSAGLTQASVPTTPKPPPALATKPVVVVPKGPPPKTLVTKDLVQGTGATVSAGQTITVNYVGVLYSNGKEFDSSWKRNQPFTTALSPGSVIQGWVKGIAGMKVGGRRELIIPPSLGYGKAGSPPTIPPNSTLIFVVDLLSVQ